jgi:glucan biosynthesis protein C
MKTTNHFYFLDNLRIVLIMLVIAQTYGPTGGWWPIQETARAGVLGPFFTVNRSFFMSLFFMISGYFTVMSVDRWEPRVFIKERFLRLGLPVLGFGLIMIPLQLFVFESQSAWPVDVGHLWFLEHLLIFSAVYALWRMIYKESANDKKVQVAPPGYVRIVTFALILATVSAVVRIWFLCHRPLGLSPELDSPIPKKRRFGLAIGRCDIGAGLVFVHFGMERYPADQ